MLDRRKLRILCPAVLAAATSFAQISVTEGDVARLVGRIGTYENTTGGGVAVDLKQAASGQTWDFSKINLDNSIVYRYGIQPVAGFRHADRFPGADHVFCETDAADTNWALNTYIRLKADSMVLLGHEHIQGADTTFSNTSNQDFFPLPLFMGKTWTSVQVDTLVFGPNNKYVTRTVSENVVDAEGRVKIPSFEFDCLRVRTTAEDENGTRWIRYSFVSKLNLLAAIVQSQPGNTDPNFTNAVTVCVFSSISSSVRNKNIQTALPRDLALSNYPNPFNPGTAVAFELPGYSHVDLSVYDTAGRRVKTLLSSGMHPGRHEVEWDGTNSAGNPVTSGVYFGRISANGRVETRRMVLIR